MIGIYVHIPFCAQKCPYCDFYSLPARQAQMEAYGAALLRAVRQAPALGQADTIYFGGGTPSLMPTELLGQVLDALREKFTPTPDAEITLEANPGTVSLAQLEQLRGMGFNRLSMGMQSAHEQELKALGRRHGAAQAAEAVRLAHRAGFENLSLDLMLGTPGQTVESAVQSARYCAQLGVAHISAYILKTEPGTPYGDNPPAGMADEDLQADIYLAVCEELEQLGYEQYEISNFAKVGKQSRHNLKYWRCEQYLGLGPSAHSFYEGRRRFFPRELAAFVEAQNPFDLLQDDGEGGTWQEELMLRLRLAEGVSLKELQSFPQFDLEVVEKKIEPLLVHGLVQRNRGRLRLTRQGMLLSNSVIAHLI